MGYFLFIIITIKLTIHYVSHASLLKKLEIIYINNTARKKLASLFINYLILPVFSLEIYIYMTLIVIKDFSRGKLLVFLLA